MVNIPQRGRRRYVLVLMVLTALTLATLDQRSGDSGPIGAAGRLAHHIVQPVANAADDVFSPVHDWWNSSIHSGDLKAENRRLRRALADALARQHEGDVARQQLHQYQAFFGVPWLDEYRSAGARVVAGPTGNFDLTMTLDKGTESHIVIGLAVVASGGLVGTVVDSWNGGSKVRLINDPAFVGLAVRLSRDSSFGTALRQGNGTFAVDLDDAGGGKKSRLNVRAGDIALTCGCNDSQYPLGVPVGTVISTQRSTDGSKLTVTIRPFLDGSSLGVVKVLLWQPGDLIPQPVIDANRLRPPPAKPTTSTAPQAGPNNTTTTASATTTTRVGG